MILSKLLCANILTVIVVNNTVMYVLQVNGCSGLRDSYRRHTTAEVVMDGIVFLVFWIGGAVIHTVVELRCKAVDARRMGATAPRKQRSEL